MESMTFEEYRDYVIERYRNPESKLPGLVEASMGLCGEAGEASEIVKKHFAQGHPWDDDHFRIELADILYYFAMATKYAGVSMEELIQVSMNKLGNRFPDGYSTEKSVNRAENDL